MQVVLPCAVLELLRDIVLYAWERVDADAEFRVSFTNIFQAVFETSAEFLEKPREAI